MSAYRSASDKPLSRVPVIVAGARTPFIKSNGAYANLMSYELGRAIVDSLFKRSSLDPATVEYLCMGSVIADPNTSNVAREIVISSTIPNQVPAHTTTMACISSNIAATTVCDMVRLGHSEIVVAGGCETFSDPPIRIARALRLALTQTQKRKGLAKLVALAKRIRFRDLHLEIPSITEFSTGHSMGQSCEQLAQRFKVTRAEADAFAARSHQLAHQAWQNGFYNDDVIPLNVTKDDGPRADTTIEKLARLKPAFAQDGINTAGNSSFLTDGASAIIVMAEDKAHALGYSPLSIVKDYVYSGTDPQAELLLGPAYAIARLLERANLHIADIGVWELHEAFAAQVVANLKALAASIGEIPLDKLNIWGGSLSLGHPFGATGTRLLWTASRRLQVSHSRYAIVAGCAAGGLGSAILLENPHYTQGA